MRRRSTPSGTGRDAIRAVPDVPKLRVATGYAAYGPAHRGATARLVWVSRDGRAVRGRPPPLQLSRLSPVSVAVDHRARHAVWFSRSVSDIFSRFTFRRQPGTPCGRLTGTGWRSCRTETAKRLSEDGAGCRLAGGNPAPTFSPFHIWSRDGLLAFADSPAGAAELCVLHRRWCRDAPATSCAPGRAAPTAPAPSPDGRWMAYASEESGRRRSPQPTPAAAVRIPAIRQRLWSGSGRVLFIAAVTG